MADTRRTPFHSATSRPFLFLFLQIRLKKPREVALLSDGQHVDEAKGVEVLGALRLGQLSFTDRLGLILSPRLLSFKASKDTLRLESPLHLLRQQRLLRLSLLLLLLPCPYSIPPSDLPKFWLTLPLKISCKSIRGRKIALDALAKLLINT
jgi:hypothetical protein